MTAASASSQDLLGDHFASSNFVESCLVGLNSMALVCGVLILVDILASSMDQPTGVSRVVAGRGPIRRARTTVEWWLRGL
jgi:hypothetical protein